MKIVVLVKEVPDTYSDRKLDLETGLADRASSDLVLDEINERSLEVALSYADAHDDVEAPMIGAGLGGSLDRADVATCFGPGRGAPTRGRSGPRLGRAAGAADHAARGFVR